MTYVYIFLPSLQAGKIKPCYWKANNENAKLSDSRLLFIWQTQVSSKCIQLESTSSFSFNGKKSKETDITRNIKILIDNTSKWMVAHSQQITSKTACSVYLTTNSRKTFVQSADRKPKLQRLVQLLLQPFFAYNWCRLTHNHYKTSFLISRSRVLLSGNQVATAKYSGREYRIHLRGQRALEECCWHSCCLTAIGISQHRLLLETSLSLSL